MVISLIHPSRGRPQKAFETCNKWLNSAGTHVKYLLSIDTTDPKKDEYQRLFEDYPVFEYDNKSVVEAMNNGAKYATGDILIFLTDDFDCPDNWALSVLKEFESEDRPLLVKIDDCLQKFDVPVLTMPIMNRKLYETLGYFFHPEYKSMFCDEGLFWTVRKLGALKNAPHLKFEHKHVSVGKSPDDETYRNSAKNWEQGKAVFAKHKAMGFPV
jgi:glycosyltransferase involved in cell wall biosynthesis